MKRFDVRVDLPTSLCFIHEYGADQAVAVKRAMNHLKGAKERNSIRFIKVDECAGIDCRFPVRDDA